MIHPRIRHLSLFLSVVTTAALGAQTPSAAGAWSGTIKAPPVPIDVVIVLQQESPDAWTGTIDIPAQGASGRPLEQITISPPNVTFAIKGVAGAPTFTGVLSADGQTIDGTVKQGRATMPFTLTRRSDAAEAQAAIKPRRPQEPARPFPYDEEEVTYKNGDVTLAGTLTRPRSGGPFPAVALITGSGAEDRDETMVGHKPFLVLADYLTRHGIAVLRADDRGVGGSTGRVNDSTSVDFAEDALAGVRLLKSRKDIDATHIGLIGHGEGGLIAPIAATRSTDVAFIVMMAGPGLPGEDILYLQGAAIAKAAGAPDAAIAANRAVLEKIFTIVKTVDDPASRAAQVRAIAPLGQADAMVTPWFRYFLTYDPRPTLRAVRCPVLAINGEHDLQVPYQENVAAIKAALDEGGNRDHTIEMLLGLNHLFQTSATGLPGEYARIEETIAPAALERITDWILLKTARS